jgi:hypothetical protein
MADVAIRDEPTEIARPLKMLVELIKQDFEQAEKAGMAYYKAAGEKLNEVRDGHFSDDAASFYAWAEKNFGKKRTQIRTYMAAAAARAVKPFKSLKKVRQDFLGHKPAAVGPGTRTYREWTATVDAVADKAREDARRLAAEDALTRQQERDAEAKLGLRLIDIGYKVLARELHPDRGGDRAVMARLNKVRERLRSNV